MNKVKKIIIKNHSGLRDESKNPLLVTLFDSTNANADNSKNTNQYKIILTYQLYPHSSKLEKHHKY